MTAPRKRRSVKPSRPRPPAEVMDAMTEVFIPSPEAERWIRDTFIDAAGRLANPDHEHLQAATLGVLWTNKHHARQMLDILAQAEKPQFQGNAWAKGRQEQQFEVWFGFVPDFVLTFYAPYAAICTEAEWCALVEHELYHCAQAKDEFGAPRFNKQTGLPVFAMRGHDVEEFVGVVRRYGAMGAVKTLVEAARKKPAVAIADIAGVCGTCTP